MRRVLSFAVVVVVSEALSVIVPADGVALAANGRIPIYGQTTISQPGSYYLTSDITNGSGVAITIAADHVTLDLAGHTITQQATVDAISSTIYTGISVFGGQINYTGNIANTASGVYLGSGGHVTVRDLNVSGPLEYGIHVDGTASSHAVIEHNTVDGASYGFYAQYLRGARIEYNNAINATGWGFFLPGLVSSVITHNTASNSGIIGFDFGPGGTQASLDLITNNLAAATSGDGFAFVALTKSTIDSNTATGNSSCGFNFQSTSSQNVYSNNRAIANTGGTYCGSTGLNTNGGGNL